MILPSLTTGDTHRNVRRLLTRSCRSFTATTSRRRRSLPATNSVRCFPASSLRKVARSQPVHWKTTASRARRRLAAPGSISGRCPPSASATSCSGRRALPSRKCSILVGVRLGARGFWIALSFRDDVRADRKRLPRDIARPSIMLALLAKGPKLSDWRWAAVIRAEAAMELKQQQQAQAMSAAGGAGSSSASASSSSSSASAAERADSKRGHQRSSSNSSNSANSNSNGNGNGVSFSLCSIRLNSTDSAACSMLQWMSTRMKSRRRLRRLPRPSSPKRLQLRAKRAKPSHLQAARRKTAVRRKASSLRAARASANRSGAQLLSRTRAAPSSSTSLLKLPSQLMSLSV